MRIVMVGPFGMQPRMTMRMRALPLGKALVRRGHAVTLLLPPWQNPEDGGRSWEEDGVRIENVTLPREVPGWFQARLAAHLVRRARELGPDIVHTFKPKAYAGLAHLALARRYPVVVDTDDWEGPGGWNAQGEYSTGLQRFFAWQERWGLQHADGVTVASRALQTLVWSMGGPQERIAYLPNGVEPSPGVASPRSDSRPTVLLYTRFFEFKLERLLCILQAVRARRPEVRVLVVGKGFAGEETHLLQWARSAGWDVVEVPAGDLPAADLVYVGFGTPENLPACFAAAAVAIYPFDDTLLNRTKCPVKLLELLAAGIPVVGDAVGQIAEVVLEGETGRLVHPRGAASSDSVFAEAVLDLLSDPERLVRMRSAARADVVARYAWDRMVDAAETAYRYAMQHHTKLGKRTRTFREVRP